MNTESTSLEEQGVISMENAVTMDAGLLGISDVSCSLTVHSVNQPVVNIESCISDLREL